MVDKQNVLPDNYDNWRKEAISLIEGSELEAIFSINAELLALYWKIGNDILIKQREQGWRIKIIRQLSKGLAKYF